MHTALASIAWETEQSEEKTCRKAVLNCPVQKLFLPYKITMTALSCKNEWGMGQHKEKVGYGEIPVPIVNRLGIAEESSVNFFSKPNWRKGNATLNALNVT